MNILSWNIEAAKGVDGNTSVERIAKVTAKIDPKQKSDQL